MLDNFLYYVRHFGYNALPVSYFRNRYRQLLAYEAQCDPEMLSARLDYYMKVHMPFKLPSEAIAVKEFKRKGHHTTYYLDLKEYFHYFRGNTRFAFHFGDETHINPHPTLFKARPIAGDNANSVLFKLNKWRHYRWVRDTRRYESKRDMLVWRGNAQQAWRKDFVMKLFEHPLCDVGQTNKPPENVPWQKQYMPIPDQLGYKFIACIEGNDVASNLKWVMSSNSLCFMPAPKYETWFMEGTLQPFVHYVEVKDDYSDVGDKIKYYISHTNEAKAIIAHAHKYCSKFMNRDLEDLLCLKILTRYAELSGQENALKF